MDRVHRNEATHGKSLGPDVVPSLPKLCRLLKSICFCMLPVAVPETDTDVLPVDARYPAVNRHRLWLITERIGGTTHTAALGSL